MMIRSFSKRGRGAAAIALAAGLGVAAIGCQSVQTTSGGVVGVTRPQRMSPLVSEAELRQGAAQAYQQVVAQERQKGNLDVDPALTARVRGIVRRLVPATAAFRADAPGWPWEVHVFRSDKLNAWVMPGGKIAVYSGLVTRLGLTDDEIAAVIGHELSHALREHGRERASEQAGVGLLAGLVSAVTGQAVTGDLARMAYGVTVGLPNSRTHEIEADRMGVEIAARAGYDPRAAVSLWQKMGKATGGGGGGPDWLSTHPSPQNRLADLATYAQRVMPLYETARSGR